MSDETGNGDFVLHCVSGCYAEVHISWEILPPTINNSNPTMIKTDQTIYLFLMFIIMFFRVAH